MNYKIIPGSNSNGLLEKMFGDRHSSDIIRLKRFSDGEFAPYINTSIRDERVFIIQSTNPPQDNLIELAMIADACRRASAADIVAIIPYLGLARQDRKEGDDNLGERTTVGAKVAINTLLANGVNKILTIDLHASQISGFTDGPMDNIRGHAIFLDYLNALNLSNTVFCSPDFGGAKRIGKLRKLFPQTNSPVLIDKSRSEANKVDRMDLIGDVTGKDVIIIDDIIDTGGTLCKAADLIMEKGALSVRAVITHPVLSGKNGEAYRRIENSVLSELVVSDTLSVAPGFSTKIRQVSCAPVLKNVIERLAESRSLASINFGQIQ